MDNLRNIIIYFLLLKGLVAFSQCNPSITGPNNVCYGETITLDAGGSYDSYQWAPNGETTRQIIVSVGDTYYVTVEDNTGCVGIDSLKVVASPQIIPNVSATKEFVCEGGNTRLSVTGAGAGGSYLWDNSLGTNQINDITVIGTVDYNVTLTDYNGCTEVGSITITSVDIPVLTIDPIDTVLCKGSSTNITVNGASNYSWFPSYGLSSTTGAVVVASPEVTTVYQVVGSNELGGTVCSSNIESRVVVDAYDFSLPPSKTLCKNEEVTIVASVNGGTAPYSYSWTINNVPNSSISASLTDTVNGVRNYQLTGVDGNGCSVTKSTIYQNYPDLVFNPQINKDTVCPNDPVLFSASISGGTGIPYEFIFDGHYSNTVLTVYPEQTYVYQLTVKDGCEEIHDSITIATYPIPYVDFVANTYGGCEPKEIKFTSITSPTGLIDSYKWNFGDNDNNNLSTSASPVHIFKNKGVFDVNLKVQTKDGCFTDTTKESLIHIEGKPNLSFKPEPLTVSILKPIVYFNNTSENVDSLSYIWNFGTDELSNIKNPEYKYNNVGNYEVELIGITRFGCSDTIYKYVEVKPEVKFYIPEAFTPDGDDHNELFIPKGTNIINKDYQFYIYDRWGEPIFETDNLDEGWDGKTKSGDYVKPGIYAYYIIFKDIYNIKYEREGIVKLIR